MVTNAVDHSTRPLQLFRTYGMSLLMAFVLALCVRPASGQTWVQMKPQYQFPLNASRSIPITTTIIVRPGDTILQSSITPWIIAVSGTLSGKHYGIFKLSDDKRTLIYKPFKAFVNSEKVYVYIAKGLKTTKGKTLDALSFYFYTVADSRGEASGVAVDSHLIDSLPISKAPATDVSVGVATPIPSAPNLTLGFVFPNPVTDVAKVSVTLATASHVTVVIHDAWHHTVKSVISDDLSADTHLLELNCADLPTGSYYVVATAGAETRVRSIFVKH